MNETIFKTYHARLKREGILRAFLWGLAIGASGAFAVAFVTWFFNFKGLFLTLGVFAGITAICTVLFYFLLYRPTAESVARRMDMLGLDERVVTMLQLEGDESYLAKIQREDAKAKLAKVSSSKLKFTVSLSLLLFLVIGGFFGLGMTTVTGLSDYDVIPTAGEIIAGNAKVKLIDVSYTANTGGTIYGNAAQRVKKNGTTEKVIAVPKEGYRFLQWADGYPYPVRSDANITKPITFTARFILLDPDGADEKVDGDEPTDQPTEDGNDMADPPPIPGGGTAAQFDYVIDGTYYYRDIFDDFYAKAIEELSDNGELTEELRRFLETYFNTIK